MRGGKLWRLGGMLAVLALPAWADPVEDLNLAIGLYDAKKSEQAVKALRAVAASSEATVATRAHAHLYIGLALSKLGEKIGATASFADAFELDPGLAIPFGTRPEIAASAEVIRAETKARLEARADLSEWASPTGLPAAPSASAEPEALPPPPMLTVPRESGFSAPPLPAPVTGRPAPSTIVKEPEPEPPNPDDGLHFGAGMRLLYNPLDEVLGAGVEGTLESQRGGRQLSAVVTLFPGRLWGVGAAFRIQFGPVIRRWRIEFGFDLGLLLYPSRLNVAVELATQVLGFSFPVGPVRVKVKLLTASVYANFFANPLVVVPTLGAGFGVEY